MAPLERPLSEKMFSLLVDAVIDQLGEEWVGNDLAKRQFSAGVTYAMNAVDGVHLIGEPEEERDGTEFNVWIDFPVVDLIEADELAFEIFARFSQELFLCARTFEERSIRYRFLTGGTQHGHVGSLIFTGPYAQEFVHLQRARISGDIHFSA
ncbi:MAG: hypothetical protein M3121_08100 [Chloroflexota bacterium]|nr:hypothetical protein [Chloroflexota bacterium]